MGVWKATVSFGQQHLVSALILGASGVAAVAGSFLVAGRSPSFVVTAAATTILAFFPDRLLATGILVLGKFGRPLLVVGALLVTIGLFAIVAAGTLSLAHWLDRSRPGAAFSAGVLQAVVAFLISGGLGASVVAGVAGGLALGVAGPAPDDDWFGGVPGRRRVLRSIGAAVATVGTGWALAPDAQPIPRTPVEDEAVLAMLDAAEKRSVALPGVEPLVSEEFYQVDINTSTPVVDRKDWSLTITGADGETAFEVDYDELTSYEAEHRFVTLRCVSDPINGEQLDNALWTGIPIERLLAEADAPADCCVRLEAADGYYQGFPRAALASGFLAWRMNGQLLPRGHGHPVRALIPGHWGEINVKWLTHIDVRDEPVTGYWEKRGWHGTGPVNTIAKIHAVDTGGESVVVGGHAYAGTRGVASVEVSVDGGETWNETELSDPLPGPAPDDGQPRVSGKAADAWRMWRYEYEKAEPHTVVARAIEPDGTVQPQETASPYPSGSTGWVSRDVDPA